MPSVTDEPLARLNPFDPMCSFMSIQGLIEPSDQRLSEPGFIGQVETKSKFPSLSGDQILVQKGLVDPWTLPGLFQVVSPFQCPFLALWLQTRGAVA